MFQNRAEALALALPAAVFATLVFLLPVAILLSEGFRAGGGWTLSAYTDFFSGTLNRTVFLRSFRLGLEVTAVSAVIGYAAAFAIVNLPAKGKGRMIGLVILPLMISPVARTYAWIVILGRTGIVTKRSQAWVQCRTRCAAVHRNRRLHRSAAALPAADDPVADQRA